MRFSASRRILFISQAASPVGGVETWLDRIVAACGQAGGEPHVGLVRGAKVHDPDRFREQHSGLPVLEIDGRGLNAEGRVRAVVRAIRRLQPDICVPLTLVDSHEAACRAKAAGLPVRYLQSIHGNVSAQIADAWRYGSWADLAVCPANLTTRLLAAGGMPGDRLRRVPNGAEPPRYARRSRPAGSPIRLAFVGRLAGNEKRVGDLVPLLDELDRLQVGYVLRIAGDGPLRAQLEQAVAVRRLAGRVTFTGRLSQAELYEHIYPDTDVLLMFSESEAFPVAVVEAMMHGLVAVSSRFIGAQAEGLLREGKTALFFNVGDLRTAAENIKRLAADEAAWRQMSAQAQAAVATGYSWEACCRSWLQAFEEVMHLPLRLGTPLSNRPLRGGGLLDRLGVSPGVRDFLRRSRIRLLGVPAAQIGGEEWPFVNTFHAPGTLAEIEALSRRLDAGEADSGVKA